MAPQKGDIVLLTQNYTIKLGDHLFHTIPQGTLLQITWTKPMFSTDYWQVTKYPFHCNGFPFSVPKDYVSMAPPLILLAAQAANESEIEE